MTTFYANDNNEQLKETGHMGRVIWPDAIRIVAVFAVIMLHAAAAGFVKFEARTVYWQVCNLYDSLARFCVPVFVMVSGMFLLNPEREYDLKKLYFTKILRIVTAYLFWASFYSIVSVFRMVGEGDVFGHEYLSVFARGIAVGHYHLWFLFMISGLYIVMPILRQIAKDEKLTIYYLVLGLVFVYLAETFNLFPLYIRNKFLAITNRLNVQLLASFSCYFLWGYWLSRHSLSPIARKIIYIMGLLAAIGTVVINGLAGYYYNHAGEWMYNYLLPNVLMMASAVFVFCQYHFQGGQLSSQWQSRIGLVGKWSFGIYLVHAFFLSIMYRVGLHFCCHPIVSIPLTTLVVFCASLAVVFILDKIPILNKYVM